ncbi:FlgB family protein [Shimia biformata]|uniref:FlgB family protein n=1 Tax=Shimia biformata TaxID=1294299 RepID=UPI001951C7C5|nr:FlgB family protein [Shimia biformata]
MFQSLEVFKISSAMASHAATRQAVIATNMANADTPGYVARDIADFKTALDAAGDGTSMRATRTGHLSGGLGMHELSPQNAATPENPNGNAVSIEEEMVKAVNTQRQHERALAVYKSSLTILRSVVGRG